MEQEMSYFYHDMAALYLRGRITLKTKTRFVFSEELIFPSSGTSLNWREIV